MPRKKDANRHPELLPVSYDEIEQAARDASARKMEAKRSMIPRERKGGGLYGGWRSMPYIDPAEYPSLESYLKECEDAMRVYVRSAGANNIPKKMVLVVSSVNLPSGDYQIIVQQRHKHGGIFHNYPGGKLYPGEEPHVAAKREYKEETGLLLVCPELVGIIGPTKQEASEIGQPWIVYVYTGKPELQYMHEMAKKPKSESASPCLIPISEISTLRAPNNIQPVAALVNSRVGEFVIETETLACNCTARIVTYGKVRTNEPQMMKYAHLELE